MESRRTNWGEYALVAGGLAALLLLSLLAASSQNLFAAKTVTETLSVTSAITQLLRGPLYQVVFFQTPTLWQLERICDPVGRETREHHYHGTFGRDTTDGV